jgi:16S rRNA C1402 (ribose-2'-O) methylase RsmI
MSWANGAKNDPAHPVLWIADSQVLALNISSLSFLFLGYLDQARSQREQAIAQARRRAHRRARLRLLDSACNLVARLVPFGFGAH